MPWKDKTKQAAYKAKYRKSAKGRESAKRYRQTHRAKLAAYAREYARNPANKKKLRAYCREHNKRNRPKRTLSHKKWSLRVLYGLSWEQYQSLVEKQNGQCAICGVVPKALVVDHDHESGAIRGLLCSECNLALGKVGDKAEAVAKWSQQAISYLTAEHGLPVAPDLPLFGFQP